ncbi:MAG TPA: thioredoxin domain-containing protein [Steroidobacteraceae bacterium]|jgi:protein-disulfide isomerase|nr:thioredoxin domain-containing protein [Steroidobacteraceae bacterium]
MTPTHQITLAVPPEPTDHSQGPEHARVVVVEYGDFECPSCKVAATTPTLLMERYPNRVRFIFRNFPLEEAHPHALLAAECAEAAAAQGRFWPMYDFLFRNQEHLKSADLQRYARELGMDMTRYAAEMDDHIYLQKVRDHMAGGRSSHIRATPAFFINGAVQDISFGMKSLHDAVAAAVSHKK